MLKVGVTGGIGSGKTLVCAVFSKLGIPVFYADNEAKNIINSDEKTIFKIKEHFGNNIYENNIIDRKKLADIIFNNPDALITINSLIHPKVRENFKIWCLQFEHLPYVIHEAAILFESNAFKELDYSINVQALEKIRIQRVVVRDKVTEDKVKERMKNQLSDDERNKLADFVIINDNESMVLPQIFEIHNKLVKLKK